MAEIDRRVDQIARWYLQESGDDVTEASIAIRMAKVDDSSYKVTYVTSTTKGPLMKALAPEAT